MVCGQQSFSLGLLLYGLFTKLLIVLSLNLYFMCEVSGTMEHVSEQRNSAERACLHGSWLACLHSARMPHEHRIPVGLWGMRANSQKHGRRDTDSVEMQHFPEIRLWHSEKDREPRKPAVVLFTCAAWLCQPTTYTEKKDIKGKRNVGQQKSDKNSVFLFQPFILICKPKAEEGMHIEKWNINSWVSFLCEFHRSG